MRFKSSDQVVWLKDGVEIPATINDIIEGRASTDVTLYSIAVWGERLPRTVMATELLAMKRAGFNVRDLALIVEHGSAVEGEIVAVGEGPTHRRFYQLKFEGPSGIPITWYNEDEIFILSSKESRNIGSLAP